MGLRILVIGGTGFIGPHVVRGLCELGHEVTVFHRGQTEAETPPGAEHVHGERQDLARFAHDFRLFSPDVVLDMFPMGRQDAACVMRVFKGLARRAIAISSQDVYRAYGGFHRLEEGTIEPVPLTEDSPLRGALYPYRGKIKRLEDYEKILVEQVVMSEPDLPGTALRLPMVYGPRDPQHRLFLELKRMDDGRPAILLDERAAQWRWSRAYAENVAAAIVLATIDERASGRVYNVAEPEALTYAAWVRAIGHAAGWSGDVVALPQDRLPGHLRLPYNFSQDLVVDTSRIRKELGYKEPVSRRVALRRTIDWERANPPPKMPSSLFDYAAEDAALATLSGS